MEALIDEEGCVQNVRMLKKLNQELAQPAMDALQAGVLSHHAGGQTGEAVLRFDDQLHLDLAEPPDGGDPVAGDHQVVVLLPDAELRGAPDVVLL